MKAIYIIMDRIARTHCIDAPNDTDVTRIVVSVTVCVLGTRVNCAKTAQPITSRIRS